jgi:hypothetical protein
MLLTLPLLLAASRDRSSLSSIARHAFAGDSHGRVRPAGDASHDEPAGTWRRDAVAATAAWALWIAEVNLCPFARKSLETSEAISYVVTEAESEAAFYADAVDCARDLAKSSDAVDPTAAIVFLVAPFYEPDDFPAFLRSVEALEDDVLPFDEVQMAGFHPEWAFGGVPDDDPLHFEKRAPHPTVSLVLVDGLEHANSAKIAADNERTLAALGVDAAARAFAGFVCSD